MDKSPNDGELADYEDCSCFDDEEEDFVLDENIEEKPDDDADDNEDSDGVDDGGDDDDDDSDGVDESVVEGWMAIHTVGADGVVEGDDESVVEYVMCGNC